MPQSPVTRAMMVQILHNLAGNPISTHIYATFNDVSPLVWQFDAINWSTGLGIVGGFDNGSFDPYSILTNAQMAVLLHNFAIAMGLELPQNPTTPTQMYNEIPIWAMPAAIFVISTNLMPENFEPHSPATRAEAAIAVALLAGLM